MSGTLDYSKMATPSDSPSIHEAVLSVSSERSLQNVQNRKSQGDGSKPNIQLETVSTGVSESSSESSSDEFSKGRIQGSFILKKVRH